MFVAAADHSMLECTLYGAADHRTVNGGTQYHPLSAAVNSLMVCGAQCGPGSMLWSDAATNIAFPPPAQR